MNDSKDKVICYNFDEKYSPSDHYKIQKLYFLNIDVPKYLAKEDYEIAMEEVINEMDNLPYVTLKIF